MTTAETVLHEMMVKLGQTPEYECISQSGPPHQPSFEFRCKAHGLVATATGCSKKKAKEEVARLMLMKMGRRGDDVPPPYKEEGPVRAHERAMTPGASRIRVADYHRALKLTIDLEKRQLALSVLSSLDESGSTQPEVHEAALMATVKALGLTVTFSEMDGKIKPLHVISITDTWPELAFAGEDRPTAVFRALRHLRLALT